VRFPSVPHLPLALSQLDLVAVDSRRLAPARLAAAVIVIGLVAATLDLKRAFTWGCAILACEAVSWMVTSAFVREGGPPPDDNRRLAYLVTALCGCLIWLWLSLMYWFDLSTGKAFLSQLIWASLLLNAISFAFRSNLALVIFFIPVSLTMIGAPLLAPRWTGAQQLMTVVGLMILAAYAFISALRNVRAAEALAAATEALERAKVAAEAANAAKSVFVATMSHEIRTPLNGVLGMTQAMSRDPLPPKQRERLDVIRQGGEVLLALLNDILDLARIETGRLELEDAVVDAAEVARGVAATFAPQAAEKCVVIRLDIAPEAEGGWRGDVTRVRQILFNLVSNAVKFTQEGMITVRLAPAPGKDGGLMMEVTDTGPGIEADRLPTLFDRFAQGGAATARQYGGSGLGLAICRELAELIGGRIAVRSDPGRGATFTVTLPLQRAPQGAKAGAAPQAGDQDDFAALNALGRPLRVLAAEDNPMNQLVLKTLLGQVGVIVAFASDGAEAVRLWRDAAQSANGDEAWDLILMDVQMPVMDGPTATRTIRAAEAEAGGARIPIIALTANAMAHQHADYLAAGMDGVVAKPLQVGELLRAMAGVMGD
jgi:signal transduction histidine kinase